MSTATPLGPPLGAVAGPGGSTTFRVWAPFADRCDLLLHDPDDGGAPRSLPMEPAGDGEFTLATDAPAGTRYRYRLDGEKQRPDPVSRSQPEGVHGPSAVIPSAHPWSDTEWAGIPLRDYVIYELHVGTFTDAGTFEAVIPHLAGLAELGITAIELMPVAEFPGTRNWGYDGVSLFAAQSSYGGPEGLKRLVDAAHGAGLAVVLDVVYNHLGPEGNYLGDFGPYFTDRYHTPWGQALNFDGYGSDQVRRFFLQNALQWTDEFRIDALRLDAVHAILDTAPLPFLEELAAAVHERAEERGRTVHLIAESDQNDPRLVLEPARGGMGLDGVWVDDFHHALHTLLTGEERGYYRDYGTLEHLRRAFERGFVYAGEPSDFRGRRHGRDPAGIAPQRFVVCAQNHDQVGNRLAGDRLAASLAPGAHRVAAASVLLSPFTPLLFMGEEYGETAPFPYFVSHGDPGLVEAVREGRKGEFSSFEWGDEPPDPQAERTFASAKLSRDLLKEPGNQRLLSFYGELLRIRREIRPITAPDARQTVEALEPAQALLLRRQAAGEEVAVVLGFGAEAADVRLPLGGSWLRRLDGDAEEWGGEGRLAPEELEAKAPNVRLAPWAVLVYTRAPGAPSQ